MNRYAIHAALFALLGAGCGSPTSPDGTPPARIIDLMVASVRDSSLTLKWTASGDDGNRGQASRYDLRYAEFSVLMFWESARPAPAPPPGRAGQADSATIHGLKPGESYNFAIRAVDEAGNWSELSNMVAGMTEDTVPPAAIIDLRAAAEEDGTVLLRWTAPGDDGHFGFLSDYDIRYSTGVIGETEWEAYTRVPFGRKPLLADYEETFDLHGLGAGTYFIAVRGIDDAGNMGAISNIASVSVVPDTLPPSPVADLAAALLPPRSALLSWTAPGDDWNFGQAQSYDLRYSNTAIDDGTWDSAVVVNPPPPDPQPPGRTEELLVGPLESGTTYFFAIKSRDDVGNESGLSNVAMVTTSVPHAWHVYVDGSGDAPTIQAAIDSSVVGDSVLVHPGVYQERLDFIGKDLVVLALQGSAETILDGSWTGGSLVSFTHGESRYAVLEGFTIRLARTHAISCLQSSPTIRGNHIVDNVSIPGGGGGITASGGPLIEGNVFDANESDGSGGCVSLYGGSPIVRRNLFRRNRSAQDGGVLLLQNFTGTCVIEENRFVENEAGDHGGVMEIWTDTGAVLIQYNLFAGNVAKGNDLPDDNGTGGALSVRGTKNINIQNNTFVGNSAINYASCTGGTILLDHATNCNIVRNIIAESSDCAIACYGEFSGEIRDNLLWNNEPEDIAAGCSIDLGVDNLTGDPLFCDPMGLDFRVSGQSPALSGSVVIGAYPQAGCGSSPGPRGGTP